MRCDDCPAPNPVCLGESAPRLCELARTRPDYRALLAASAPEAPPESFVLSEALAKVSACPHRGSVLPHALQKECGCGELTECRAGRGRVSGRVALADCIGCVAGGGGFPAALPRDRLSPASG